MHDLCVHGLSNYLARENCLASASAVRFHYEIIQCWRHLADKQASQNDPIQCKSSPMQIVRCSLARLVLPMGVRQKEIATWLILPVAYACLKD